MSATRNPYYQLPGGADLPGDVRVSDTPDATKTAAGGWAASPAAVAAATEVETGTIEGTNIPWTRYGHLVIVECSDAIAIKTSIPAWNSYKVGKLPFEPVNNYACANAALARTGNGRTVFNGVIAHITDIGLTVLNWGDTALTDVYISFSLSYICK